MPKGKHNMKELIEEMLECMFKIKEELEQNTKAAEAQTRKATLLMDKLNKRYRKESIAKHKK